MLKSRSVAICVLAVISVLGLCVGAQADWRMMTAGMGCSSVIVAY